MGRTCCSTYSGYRAIKMNEFIDTTVILRNGELRLHTENHGRRHVDNNESPAGEHDEADL